MRLRSDGVDAEGVAGIDEALDILASFLIDLDIGRDLFGTPLGFRRDVLAAPTSRLLEGDGSL